MQFYSTNRHSPPASLREAVMRGLAPDGGLYMPERIPVIPAAFFNNIADMSLTDISYVVANQMLSPDIDSAEVRRLVAETFTFDIPLMPVRDDIYSLELYHGPTKAFKDVGARFLARIISHFAKTERRGVKVLTATSGDSGGAVAAGFRNVPGVEVYVLYPTRTLSAQQRAQFTLTDTNIRPVEVLGTFDDCQRLVRAAFLDPELRSRATLTSANSINICRLLPQMFYFYHAYASLLRREGMVRDLVISIPAGNLGNLTAALLAKRMGLPVKRLISASNANAVTPDYLSTGVFTPRRAVRTVASSMDTGNPSNMPRIADLCGDDHEALSRIVTGCSVADEEILSTMALTRSASQYLLDPHGATAMAALVKGLRPGEKGIFLSTAHPSKFPRVVEKATGVTFPAPPAAERHAHRIRRISASPDALRRMLLENMLDNTL